MKKILIDLSIPILRLMFLLSFGSSSLLVHAQYKVNNSNSLERNLLLYFMADYERALNPDSIGINKELFLKFFYNSRVEVYNDFNKSYPKRYLSARDYIDTLANQKEKFIYSHDDLKILKINNYGYYDIIDLEVRQSRYRCPYKINKDKYFYVIDKISLDTLEQHYRENLILNILYYKYQANDQFKILKIAKSNESVYSDGWYKVFIPDEVRLEYTSSFSHLNQQGEFLFSENSKQGYGVNFLIENRIAGLGIGSLTMFTGVGYQKIKNEWDVNSYNAVIDDLDKDQYPYKKYISANSINQNLDLSFLKIPLGFSLRFYPFNNISFIASSNIEMWWLNTIGYSLNSGSVNYTGEYIISGHQFNISNVPEYGFSNYEVIPASSFSFNNFGIAFTLSGSVSLKLKDNFDIYCGPSFNLIRMGKNSSAPEVLTKEAGITHPVAEALDNTTFSNSGLTFGLRMKLNNVDKYFLKPVSFKAKAHNTAKNAYKGSFISSNQNKDNKENSMEKVFKISLKAVQEGSTNIKEVKYYLYKVKKGKSGNSDSELKFGTIKIQGKPKKITVEPGQKLYIVKPFGYDAFIDSSKLDAKTSELRIDTLEQLNLEVKLRKLVPLHIMVTSKFNASTDDDEDTTQNYLYNMKKEAFKNSFLETVNEIKDDLFIIYVNGDKIDTHSTDEKCLTYDTIKKIDLDNIFPETDDSKELNKSLDKNYIYNLRTTYSKDFLPGRRKIYLHCFLTLEGDNEANQTLFNNILTQDNLIINQFETIQIIILNSDFENVVKYCNKPINFNKTSNSEAKWLFLVHQINSDSNEKSEKDFYNGPIQLRNIHFKEIILSK